MYVFSVGRLQTTTVKTTWNEPATDPVTEIHRPSTHSHSVVNGHAHAQVMKTESNLNDSTKYNHYIRLFDLNRLFHL